MRWPWASSFICWLFLQETEVGGKGSSGDMLCDTGTFLGKRFPFWTQDLLCHVSFVSILTSVLIHNSHNLAWGFLKLSLKRFLYFKSLPSSFLSTPTPHTHTYTYSPSCSISDALSQRLLSDAIFLDKDHNRVLVNVHLTHFIFRSSFLSLCFPFSHSLQPIISLLYTCLMLPF